MSEPTIKQINVSVTTLENSSTLKYVIELQATIDGRNYEVKDIVDDTDGNDLWYLSQRIDMALKRADDMFNEYTRDNGR